MLICSVLAHGGSDEHKEVAMATREDELLRKYEEFQREGLRFLADFFKAVGEQGSTDPEKKK